LPGLCPVFSPKEETGLFCARFQCLALVTSWFKGKKIAPLGNSAEPIQEAIREFLRMMISC